MAAVSGHTTTYIFYEMPLEVVFSYEHFYYVQNGMITKPKGWKSALDELVQNV